MSPSSEWINNMKKLFENWRKHLNEEHGSRSTVKALESITPEMIADFAWEAGIGVHVGEPMGVGGPQYGSDGRWARPGEILLRQDDQNNLRQIIVDEAQIEMKEMPGALGTNSWGSTADDSNYELGKFESKVITLLWRKARDKYGIERMREGGHFPSTGAGPVFKLKRP
tara:strand:- start:64 stop:570 length:507 start_codon:yes stop_codon:yes gene_type:complete